MVSPLPVATAAVAAPSEGVSTIVSYALLLVSVAFSVAGQVTLKLAMDRVGRIGGADVQEPGPLFRRALREPRLWAGLFLFGISALFWLVVLSRIPLSVAYPFVGVSYVLIVVLARYLLGETVPAVRWAGVIVIAAGITVIGMSFQGTQ